MKIKLGLWQLNESIYVKTVEQESANFFYKVSDTKYFRVCCLCFLFFCLFLIVLQSLKNVGNILSLLSSTYRKTGNCLEECLAHTKGYTCASCWCCSYFITNILIIQSKFLAKRLEETFIVEIKDFQIHFPFRSFMDWILMFS